MLHFKIGQNKFLWLKSWNYWTYIIENLNGEEIVETFYEKVLQKANKIEFRIKKLINRKGDKLYVQRKGYDNSFNGWFDKKDMVA